MLPQKNFIYRDICNDTYKWLSCALKIGFLDSNAFTLCTVCGVCVCARIYSLHSDVYVGQREGSAAYRKWYYEVQVTQFQFSSPSSNVPHLRVGWAHTSQYQPHPSSNGTNTLCKQCVCVSAAASSCGHLECNKIQTVVAKLND